MKKSPTDINILNLSIDAISFLSLKITVFFDEKCGFGNKP